MGLAAVFWDNDGVLVDTEELYYDTTRAVLAGAGCELTVERYREVSLRHGRSAFDLVRGIAGEEEIEVLRQQRNALYATRLEAGVPVLDGVAETLASLHGRVAMAVVTSCNPEHFQLIHRDTGLLHYFDFVLTNRDYAHTKPHPSPYLAALARAGVAAEQCIAVEDSERGLAAARAAGLRCIVVPRGLTRGGDFSDAYRVVEHTRELATILADLL